MKIKNIKYELLNSTLNYRLNDKKNWTEGQMLREWQYHKVGYNLFK